VSVAEHLCVISTEVSPPAESGGRDIVEKSQIIGNSSTSSFGLFSE